jgi:hypothetical protein
MCPTIGGNTSAASVTIHTIIVIGDSSIFISTAEAIQCRCHRQIPYKPMRYMQP